MSNINLQNQAIWVDTTPQLHHFIDQLTHETMIAVDTESDSLYSYVEKVCLIQFSTSQADYLIDPLNVDISNLGAIFANPNIQKVFHAAEYDILCLKRDYNFTFNHLFDTMLAARILGWEQYGLGPILAKHFAVTLNKKFQRYNWGQRPLDEEALSYARLDTHYLLRLQQIQLEQLQQRKRLQQANDAFKRLAQITPTPKQFNPDDFWRLPDIRHLHPHEQGVARQLFILREQIAQEFNVPLFKIWHNSVLVQLAQQKPRRLDDLANIKGLHPRAVQLHAADILQAVHAGLTSAPPTYNYQRNRTDVAVTNRYEALRSWRNELAAHEGMEPDVIMDNQSLMTIARHNPHNPTTLTKIEALSQWQIETYGAALLDILKHVAG
jgi:ribonuclease D